MQNKAELVGGPYDGEIVEINEKDPIPTFIAAGKKSIHQYTLSERYKDKNKEWYYSYFGNILIGNKKPK
jgi:hypothetical protein